MPMAIFSLYFPGTLPLPLRLDCERDQSKDSGQEWILTSQFSYKSTRIHRKINRNFFEAPIHKRKTNGSQVNASICKQRQAYIIQAHAQLGGANIIWNPMTEVTSTCSMAMGVWDILREALRIPFRNMRLMLSIALTCLILSSLVLLANHFYLIPVTKDLVLNEFLLHEKDPTSSEYTKLLARVLQEIQILVGEEIIFILVSYVISLFLTVAMIYATAASYSSKQLNLKELILMIARTWKRPLITSFYIALLGIGYAMLLVPLIVLLVVTSANGSIIFIVFGALIALLLLFLIIYLGAIWKLGLVISVVEERFSGMKALGRAEELIKGRKLQGFVLSLLLELIYSAITGLFVFKAMDINLAKATRLVIELVFTNVICLLQLFLCMVFTVFYFQCKKSHGGEVETQVEFGYHLVSTNPQVDASVP